MKRMVSIQSYRADPVTLFIQPLYLIMLDFRSHLP